MNSFQLVPKVGDIYNYYDDGKITLGRQLKVVITKVVHYTEFTKGLYNRWRWEKFQSDRILNDFTDYILYVDLYTYNGKLKIFEWGNKVETSIKLARAGERWYAFDNWWSGLLDVDGELTKMLIERYNQLNKPYIENPTVEQVKEWLKQ